MAKEQKEELPTVEPAGVQPTLPNMRPKVQMLQFPPRPCKPLHLPPMQQTEPSRLEGMIGFLEDHRKNKRSDGLYKWVLWKQALTDSLLRYSKLDPEDGQS